MHVELISDPRDILQQQKRWNELAPHPFMTWDWLGSWWNHYGTSGRLFVLAVKRNDEYVGFAPWYLEKRAYEGKVVQFLGSGHVCTDHMSLLCAPEDAGDCAGAIAKWLVESPEWDHLELIGVDEGDLPVNLLFAELQACGLSSRYESGLSCYGIPLPATWPEYQARRSKSGKHECRKLRKLVDTGDFEFHVPQDIVELESCWFDFVDLHQRRREALGDPGCFAIPPFREFLWEASTKLLDRGLLQLTIVLHKSVPIAAQYAVKSDTTLYFYQSGLDPDHMQYKPGQLLLYQTIGKAIDQGLEYFDMMRGDETYKLRWRGEESITQEFRVTAPRLTPRLQHEARKARERVASWVHSARDSARDLGRAKKGRN